MEWSHFKSMNAGGKCHIFKTVQVLEPKDWKDLYLKETLWAKWIHCKVSSAGPERQ